MITIVRETPNYIYCLCPMHKDTKPSLVASKTGPFAGMFICYGCGYHGWATDLEFDFVAHLQSPRAEQNWVEWQHQASKPAPDKVISQAELAREWNVSVGVLYRLGYGWDGEAHTFPMFNEKLEVIGIQRRYPNNRKVCVEGSRLGLFIPTELSGIRNLLLITEGVSDCAVALDMQFLAIGRPSALCGERLIRRWLVEHWYRPKRMLIVADNDKIGRESAMNLQKILIQNGWRCGVFVPPAKDLRQAVVDFGKATIKDMLGGFAFR